MLPKNKNNKYDFKLDLDWAVQREDELHKILQHGDTIELKTEKSLWNKTGNVAVETECRGKPSCISVSKSSWWSIGLVHKGKTLGFFIFRTEVFRKNLEYLIKKGLISYVMGGDNRASKIYLIPINRLWMMVIPRSLNKDMWFTKKKVDNLLI